MNKSPKIIRISLAAAVLAAALWLFLDQSGTAHRLMGWVAKVQLIPAILAFNVVVIVALAIVTLLFGRVYCSIICPLGITQDIISRLGGIRRKNRFGWRKPMTAVRYGILAAFALLMFFGLTSIASLIEPYSAFGRIVTAFLNDSTAVIITAATTLVTVGLFAWFGGRLWCNSVCPVGSLLGIISKYSLFRPVIDTEKCTGCTACARKCKASCINPKEHSIDMSRCVMCMDCLDNCRQGAIGYKFAGWKKKAVKASEEPADPTRRGFITAAALAGTAATLGAQQQKVDGGLAVLEDKKEPERETPVLPAGSISLRHLSDNCVSCQLCISKCPTRVLRPSISAGRLMQPEMDFRKGFCRFSCNVCGEVCPTAAITKVTSAEKSAISTGHAVWIRENCVAVSKGDSCGNCARHCPTGAINMVPIGFGKDIRIPAIDATKCIGCGSCEYHCPSRPYSAIYVVGHEVHSQI